MVAAAKSSEVRRILERYLIEVVERYELCPWARAARTGGEIAIDVLFGAPTIEAWIAAARAALARPGTRIAMIVAPELANPSVLRRVRDAVAAALPDTGIADFHPRATLDLATPARLVPWLRRSPDPMLQLVPLALLASLREGPPPDRGHQARILADRAAPPRDAGAQIAAANHATVSAHHTAIEAALDEIARDRDASYARFEIIASR